MLTMTWATITMEKSRQEVMSTLKKLGADPTAPAIQNAADDQLYDLAEGLVKLRDNKLARFIVGLIGSVKS